MHPFLTREYDRAVILRYRFERLVLPSLSHPEAKSAANSYNLVSIAWEQRALNRAPGSNQLHQETGALRKAVEKAQATFLRLFDILYYWIRLKRTRQSNFPVRETSPLVIGSSLICGATSSTLLY